MADFSTPVLGTAYATFLTNLKDRDVDCVRWNDTRAAAATNLAQYAKRWNNTSKVFQDYDGVSSWSTLVLAIAGGGTGATTAANARTNLGLGTMATQAASAVAITGGSITDVGLAFTTDAAKNIGANTYRLGKLYLRNALIIPVGTDKFATS